MLEGSGLPVCSCPLCPHSQERSTEKSNVTQHYVLKGFFKFSKHQQCNFAEVTILENELGLTTIPSLPVRCIWVSAISVLPAFLPGLGTGVKG